MHVRGHYAIRDGGVSGVGALFRCERRCILRSYRFERAFVQVIGLGGFRA